jgi:hypothetical protein
MIQLVLMEQNRLLYRIISMKAPTIKGLINLQLTTKALLLKSLKIVKVLFEESWEDEARRLHLLDGLQPFLDREALEEYQQATWKWFIDYLVSA